MKKPLIAVVGLVAAAAAAYVGGTFYVGQQVQRELQAQSERLTTQVPFIKITEQQYDKGLFSATRTVTMKFGCERGDGAAAAPGRPPQSFELTLRDHIKHGPLIGGTTLGAASIESELVLPPEAEKVLAQMFDNQKPLTITTLVGFDRNYTSRIESPRARLEGGTGQLFVWQGMQATLRGDAAGEALTYDFNMPGFEVSDTNQGMRVSLTDMRWKGEGRRYGDSLFVMTGKDEGQIGLMEMSMRMPMPATGEARPFLFALTDLKFNSQVNVENDLLTTSTTMLGGGSFGGTKLDKLEMVVSLKRLHAPSYQRLMSNLMKQSFSCEGDGEPDPQAMMATMQEDLMKLLPHNPEYALDKLAVEYGGKRGEISYAVGVKGVTEADAQMPPMALLMTKGEARADVKLPISWIEELLNQAPVRATGTAPEPEMLGAMIDQFAEQGYVVRDGEHVAASVRFGNGALLLNGKPLPVGMPPAQ
nr:YdgA family protein [uncultured Caldimonas sp.]